MLINRKCRYLAAFSLLGAGTFIFIILNIFLGSIKIALPEMIGILAAGPDNTETINRILWDIRLPRATAVLILGGALSLAGYLLQTFFHNPIAGPFVLGISSGAKMTVALVMIFYMERTITVTSTDMIVSAFTGAMISMGFVLVQIGRASCRERV